MIVCRVDNKFVTLPGIIKLRGVLPILRRSHRVHGLTIYTSHAAVKLLASDGFNIGKTRKNPANFYTSPEFRITFSGHCREKNSK